MEDRIFYLVCKTSTDINPSKKAYTLKEARRLKDNIPLRLQSADRLFYIAKKGFLWFPCNENNY